MLCNRRCHFHPDFCSWRSRYWSPHRPLHQEVRSDLSAASDFGSSTASSVTVGVEENKGSSSIAFLLKKSGPDRLFPIFPHGKWETTGLALIFLPGRLRVYDEVFIQVECELGFGRIIDFLAFSGKNSAGPCTCADRCSSGCAFLSTGDCADDRSNAAGASDHFGISAFGRFGFSGEFLGRDRHHLAV